MCQNMHEKRIYNFIYYFVSKKKIIVRYRVLLKREDDVRLIDIRTKS